MITQDAAAEAQDTNPFALLAEMFPDERFDEIGRLFDEPLDADFGAGDDQWKLFGLAVLLGCLEDTQGHPDVDALGPPVLCKLQALEVAYRLGQLAGPG